jgi:two-component system chemotaxis sensor kinase CheA
MDMADPGLIAEFVVESQEGLANIEQQMLAIEAGGAGADAELINAVFRTMHTIKGSAGFLGLDRIGSLAHGLEEVLNGMRNHEIPTSSELVSTILQGADRMKALIDSIETSNDADISENVALLQRFRPGAAPLEPQPATPVSGTLSEAAREYLVECHENLDQMEEELLALEQTPQSEQLLRSLFRTMHTIKGGAGFLGLGALEQIAHAAESLLGRLRDGGGRLTTDCVAALLAAVDQCRCGLRLVEQQGSDAAADAAPIVARLAACERVSTPTEARPTATTTESAAPAAVCPTKAAPTSAQASAEKSAPVGDTTIRVDVGLLDKLMTRVGELVLARNQIVQYTSRLGDTSFVSTAQRLNLITTELQESVMKTRMQPIGNVWAKFPRVVRDLAAQLGKQVCIDMEGKETELDKTIVEAIKDPLTHLVRNSIDHGIELPEVRRAAGKSPEGRLLLRAYHEGGQVNIEITDDGAGLNLDRIRQKAVERGIVPADQAARMSDRDVSQLIFAPGFSTAEKVTSVSGRGVGMDVVKTNIERISGTIDLQSRPGRGTTIRIKIPLTLAIIPALVVTNDGDRYAIPQVSLLELVRLDGDEARRSIEHVHGAPVYRLRGKLLPLVHLSERLGIAKPPADKGETDVLNIVVLRANDRQFGLVVDKVNDTEEIVVKPLSRQLKGLSEFAGATIMGDGTIALILDVMGLAVAAGLAGEMRDTALAVSSGDERRPRGALETLLVVDLGDTRRFALPTCMVSRLEQIATSAIEYAEGREVIQYRGSIMPLVRLGEVLGSQGPPETESNQLLAVVCADEDRSCGLIVHRILDIAEVELNTLIECSSNGYLLGTCVLHDHVTDVLNLKQICQLQARQKFSIRPVLA